MDIGKRPGAFTGIDILKKEEAMLENIVDYLTDGYCESTGSTRRKFDVQPSGTLTVNITALTPEGQQLARWAWRHGPT